MYLDSRRIPQGSQQHFLIVNFHSKNINLTSLLLLLTKMYMIQVVVWKIFKNSKWWKFFPSQVHSQPRLDTLQTLGLQIQKSKVCLTDCNLLWLVLLFIFVYNFQICLCTRGWKFQQVNWDWKSDEGSKVEGTCQRCLQFLL